MTLLADAFKDFTMTNSTDQTQVNVFFSPDYLQVSDTRGVTHKVVEAIVPNKPTTKPFYVIQMMNVDNQKMKLVKLSIDDIEGLTSS